MFESANKKGERLRSFTTRSTARCICGVAAFLLASAGALSSGACSQLSASAEGAQTETISILIRPGSGRDEPSALKWRLAFPRAYLPRSIRSETESTLDDVRIPFVARESDFAPAGDISAAAPGIISGIVSWAPETYVSERVDGSWLNSYSKYSIPLGSRFGLEMRETKMAHMHPAKLYVLLTPEQDTMIECDYMPHVNPRFCQMWTKRPRKPAIRVSFHEDRLAHWLRISTGMNNLLEQWLEKP
ncbi:hypothetical protein [Sphingosinicella sp. LY1275]|uniref:hypothetical protein n=1 Tax=Sphingosinicella sp. LY1275 TaxID=3095379 RepID=UPI002ADEB56C|nr:hypothetical protein [Sphingosinicella sp. LY1275]MEA1013544.1 hypothetical protein [Sphingosinicella sp. LY1275]